MLKPSKHGTNSVLSFVDLYNQHAKIAEVKTTGGTALDLSVQERDGQEYGFVITKEQALEVGLALVRWAQTGKLESVGSELFKVDAVLGYVIKMPCAGCGNEALKWHDEDPDKARRMLIESANMHTYGYSVVGGKPYCQECAAAKQGVAQ